MLIYFIALFQFVYVFQVQWQTFHNCLAVIYWTVAWVVMVFIFCGNFFLCMWFPQTKFWPNKPWVFFGPVMNQSHMTGKFSNKFSALWQWALIMSLLSFLGHQFNWKIIPKCNQSTKKQVKNLKARDPLGSGYAWLLGQQCYQSIKENSHNSKTQSSLEMKSMQDYHKLRYI